MVSIRCSLGCCTFNWDRRLRLRLESVLKRIRSDVVIQISNKGTPHTLTSAVVRTLENTYAGFCRRETPRTEESRHSAPKTTTVHTHKQ